MDFSKLSDQEKRLYAAQAIQPQSQYMARVPWWFCGVFAGVGLIGMLIAGFSAGIQHYRLVTYQPVPAKVISSHVEARRGRKSTTYEPVISYTYMVNGELYQYDRVMAVGNFSSSGAWAWDICNRYPADTLTTAWYSPTDPRSAFLIKEASFVPHLLVGFTSLFFTIGAFLIAIRIHGSRRPKPPALTRQGLYQVFEERTIGGRFRLCLITAALWTAYWMALVGDYFLVNGNNFDTFCIIAAAIGAGLGLIPFGMAWRYLRLHHDFLDAEIQIDKNRIRPGDTIKVQLHQSVLRPLMIDELAIGAVCICNDVVKSGSKTSYVANESWSNWKTAVSQRQFGAGSQISGQVAFAIPADASASGASEGGAYPFYQWFFALRIKSEGEPQLNVRFPIVMEPADPRAQSQRAVPPAAALNAALPGSP